MAKVILDPGHGGNNLGAVSGSRYEKNDNLKLALEVGRILENNGVNVVYTRFADEFVSPINRVNTANQEGGDLFVSIHRGYSPIPGTESGVRSSIYEVGGLPEKASLDILKKLEKLRFRNLGINIRKDYITLRNQKMPTLLLEVGFMNSNTDNEIFDSRFNEIAEAIASGITEALGIRSGQPAKPEGSARSLEVDDPYCYKVQVGSFRTYDNAVKLQYQLIWQGFSAEIMKQGDYFAVLTGSCSCLDEAVILERTLRTYGYQTLLTAL
jgi:N-acetylmuramoyl-L-alanine amidase